MVADIAMPVEKSQAIDRMEGIRDPSHVYALTSNEFELLIAKRLIRWGCLLQGNGKFDV